MKRHNPNYEKENYCASCDMKYPKGTVWCTSCGMKIRTVPHSGKRNKKYLTKKSRY